MKRNILFFAFALLSILNLSACGYKIQGQEESRYTYKTATILGDGSKSLRIDEVEQATLYPWLPFYVMQKVRDEINLRNIAEYSSSLDADYYAKIEILSFDVTAFDEDYYKTASLTSADVRLNIDIFETNTNSKVWSSGTVAYSETYERIKSEQALREILQEAIKLAFDRIQYSF